MCLVILCGVGFADEAADRAAIRKVLEARELRVRPASEPLSCDFWPCRPAELSQPVIQFITGDVAIADWRINGRALLFVLKKEGAEWKIAAVRRGS